MADDEIGRGGQSEDMESVSSASPNESTRYYIVKGRTFWPISPQSLSDLFDAPLWIKVKASPLPGYEQDIKTNLVARYTSRAHLGSSSGEAT